MKSLKQQALDAIASLPETATLDDIMYSLYVIDKIRQGQQDIRNGKTVTTEELRQEMASW